MDSAASLHRFNEYISSVRTPATARQYVPAAAGFLRWLEAQDCFNLEGVPKTALALYSQYLVAGGYKPSTVQLRVFAVSRYLKWCRTFGGYQLPEFIEPELPKIEHRVKDALGSDVLGRYFELCVSELAEPVRTATMLLPCSGLRGAEMSSLALNSPRRVTIPLKGGKTKDTIALVVKGKGGNDRLVPLLDEGAELLRRYLSNWRRSSSDSTNLFPGRKKQHLADRTLRMGIEQVRVHLPDQFFTAHTMRRTYITRLYRMGVEPVMLAKIVGHKSVNTMMKHYLALDEQDIVNAVHMKSGRLVAKRGE